MTWVVKAWKPDAFAARLAALEELGDELREDVRRRRSSVPREEITVRRGRASMRESPLGELFRATGARPPAEGRPTSGDAPGREGSRFGHSGAHAAGARRPDRA